VPIEGEVQQNSIFIILMATIFGHNGHHQAVSHKLKKKPVHIVFGLRHPDVLPVKREK
jgi:hypothetical protein